MNILFLTSELSGIAKTGGLADVAKALPKELAREGHTTRVVMPYYSSINPALQPRIIGTFVLPTAPNAAGITYQVYELELAGFLVCLLKCDRYFERPCLYDDHGAAYPDNGERFAFLAAAALDLCTHFEFRPDIVHANDWHTALAPMILRTRYAHTELFSRTGSVLTIHNGSFQGVYDRGQLWLIPEIAYNYQADISQGGNNVNFLKCGVLYADQVNTVSPSYAQELMTTLGGHGMCRIYQYRAESFRGIVNGCDYTDWNPESDQLIPVNFTSSSLESKAICKHELQKLCELPVCDLPVFGMVCRLTEQKGINLLLPIVEEFLYHRVELIIQGSGDPRLEERLQQIAAAHPDRFHYTSAFDNRLAHMIEAGSQFFLMPSLFEPCGLNQMYSLAYGTLPIVRAVGGLKDTVIDYDRDHENATGFSFAEPEPISLLSSMRRALLFYLQEPEEYYRLQCNAMKTRYEWRDSAGHYLEMYRDAAALHQDQSQMGGGN